MVKYPIILNQKVITKKMYVISAQLEGKLQKNVVNDSFAKITNNMK